MSKRVASLDLGTNSFHLLLASLDLQRQEIQIEKRLREFVFLGRGLVGEPPVFSEEVLSRAMETLRFFVQVSREAEADPILAVGTEAFRRAQNAHLLLSAAKHELGLEIQVLSGAEEARLIHEGVKFGLPLPDTPYLVVDIGGGSVEFIVGQRGEIEYLISLPLGVTALQRRFPEGKGFSEEQLTQIRNYIRTTLSPLLESISRPQITQLIGTSGTFKTLGRLIAHHVGDTLAAQNIHQYRFSPMLFYPILQKLLTLSEAERIRLRGMQPERAALMPYGALLVESLLQAFPIQHITISDYALREGVVYAYAQSLFEGRESAEYSLREKTLRHLAEKYRMDIPHAQLSRRWAETLFDLLAPLHRLGPQEREALAHAAYLHDIGHFINPSGHHKHGLYILLNSPMPGFTPEEALLLANLVRYHRKSLPSSEHFHYSALPRAQKKIIGLVAPILRLADQLAKYLRHEPIGVELQHTDQEVELTVDTWEAGLGPHVPAMLREVGDFFERSYNRRFSLRLAWRPR